ncbi:MAG: acetylneuraminic acid synthetase [Actinobacteria bacterium]|uniref:Unannotated protein n=1 Tax=freshwater metagenome TaxID=449393 RepID=A0A6J6QHC1_9ZZZZ|nr:acetylneuraminic acid synthetase [Actinomycetota bacterium]
MTPAAPIDLTAYAGWDAPIFLIAEAGVNHGGDLDTAREMVRAAAAAGVDAIKFQTYSASRIATKASAAYWDRTQEPTATQFELFSKYDALGEADYRALAAECAAAGVLFLTTPFDIDCVSWLEPLVGTWKIASADITNPVLLRRVARTGKSVALSTGASTLEEIAAAVALLRAEGAQSIALLQCTLSYPTAAADAAVGGLVDLHAHFPELALGYSDHTQEADSYAVIAAAYTLGARVIEKHFTLDASLPGNDHYHALEPDGFVRLRSELNRLRTILGAPTKDVLDNEQAARTHARRSLVSRGDLAAGSVITEDALDVKRPGTGISPVELDAVLGRRLAVGVPDDTTLQWDMFEGADER